MKPRHYDERDVCMFSGSVPRIYSCTGHTGLLSTDILYTDIYTLINILYFPIQAIPESGEVKSYTEFYSGTVCLLIHSVLYTNTH